MSHSQEKLPEWMLKLENKRKKQHRLAHEIGAGAPCFVCGDNCPGLDLHFWRKLCRNCKCKKEDHDVKDDEGYEQFEILLGSGSRRNKIGGVLKIKISEDSQSPVIPNDNSSKGVSFDWIPPNVSEEVATEYMQKLPAGKLPISGSDGALYRRQQLTKQMPLHDLDANHCHNLTPEEIEELVKYLENLKSNVFGQGFVSKVPTLFAETKPQEAGRVPLMSGSQSADSIRPLPPMPPIYNSMPRPFHASSSSSAYGSGEDDDLPPPPLPTSLPPRADLKTPSEFIPDWRLPDDRTTAVGKVIEGMQGMQLNQTEVPSSLMKEKFAQENTLSSVYQKQLPQFSSTLHRSHQMAATDFPFKLQTALSQGAGANSTFGKHPTGYTGGLESFVPVGDNQLEAVQNTQSPQFTDKKLLGSQVNTGLAENISDKIVEDLSANSVQISSVCSGNTVHSSTIQVNGEPMTSKPFAGWKAVDRGVGDSPCLVSGVQQALDSQSSVITPRAIAQSEAVGGFRGIAEPLKSGKKGNIDGSTPEQCPEENTNLYGSCPEYNSQKRSYPLSTQLNYSVPGLNENIIAPTHPVEGVKTASIVPHSIVQSFSVSTDALPKSAQMMQQQYPMGLDPAACIIAVPGSTAPLPAETPGGSTLHLDCNECGLKVHAGEVAVFAERAGSAAWHPNCFVCSSCKELLVDLMYFYHRNNVYCGRHYAELLGIPRCFACDELIFVKEHTVAEGKAFHVKHFCCYECDDPLAGKQYIPVDDQPVCLECYDRMYGKKCHTCKSTIAAGDQRVGWKHLNWHVQGNCFRCFECAKLLLGGRFTVKENQPFCSRECLQIGLQKMAGAA